MSAQNAKIYASRFSEKMKRAGQPQAVIDAFLRYYDALCHGKDGRIPEDEILPVAPGEIDDAPQYDAAGGADADALSRTAVVKLNGGLGTSMGLNCAKSLIPVKNGLSFLDVTALQVRELNARFGISIPLVMMNSFRTDKVTLDALKLYDDIFDAGIPPSFTQHKFPKVSADDLSPAEYEKNPTLEWNPPGHGDLYAAIANSGILDTLVEKGYEFAFISNIDNLGATLDTRILKYFADKNCPFMMEVTDRTHMDRKGGHIAKLKNGKLILREAAQCPKCSLDSFMDTNKHRYFNTNNLWIRLSKLKEANANGALELPMICNRKILDANDNTSPEVIQFESAMGAALSVFEDAAALRVPRSRFAPVKNCEELLLLWSDYFELTSDYRVVMNAKHKSIQMDVKLDERYYKTLDRLKERFPHGAPSLATCDSLCIVGDVRFGKNIVMQGDVKIINPTDAQFVIDDNKTFCNETYVMGE